MKLSPSEVAIIATSGGCSTAQMTLSKTSVSPNFNIWGVVAEPPICRIASGSLACRTALRSSALNPVDC